MNSKPSKSARKREQQALQELGERLIDLSGEKLGELDLDERLLDAVIAAKSIRAHGALRRQKQLIGKLMRNVDPEPIRAMLATVDGEDLQARRMFRDAESWRDRLEADPADLPSFFDFTGSECATIVAALDRCRTAIGEREQKAARRQLFREIHGEIARKVQKGPPAI